MLFYGWYEHRFSVEIEEPLKMRVQAVSLLLAVLLVALPLLRAVDEEGESVGGARSDQSILA